MPYLVSLLLHNGLATTRAEAGQDLGPSSPFLPQLYLHSILQAGDTALRVYAVAWQLLIHGAWHMPMHLKLQKETFQPCLTGERDSKNVKVISF